MTRQEFTHLDGDGRIHMVDISAKEPSHRVARASCLITGVADPQSAPGPSPQGRSTSRRALAPLLAVVQNSSTPSHVEEPNEPLVSFDAGRREALDGGVALLGSTTPSSRDVVKAKGSSRISAQVSRF